MSARTPRAVAVALTALALASPASAQQGSVGVGVDFMGYSFDDGLGVDASQLLMIPLAVRYPVGQALAVDLYSAWAEGRVENAGVQYSLSGPVDTRIKASYQVTPWALVSLTGTIPTGNSTHSGTEALVASALSADLLGYREATWGAGGGLTSSVATAVRAGEWGVGVAGAYTMRTEFQPQEDYQLRYRPGNEVRVRLAVDRNIGTNTFTAGATLMNFTADRAEFTPDQPTVNLFQPGLRARFDASYLFRAGAGIWTIYVADVLRQRGDLNQFSDSSTVLSTTKTPSQNMMVAGLRGTIGVGGNFVFRPHLDFKYQTREEADGSDRGSGWIMAAGGDFPVRLFGVNFFPKARALYGSVRDDAGTARSLLGMEFVGTLQFGL